MNLISCVFAILLLAVFSQTSAQTRRHKFLRQAYLQGNTDYNPDGSIGIESIFIFENDFNQPDTFYLPNNDITYTVNQNLQFDAGLNFIYSKNNGRGLQPMDFSVKYNIFDEDKKVPQIDFEGTIQTQGLGSQKLSLGRTLPSFKFYATKNFSKNFHSTFDAGMQWLDAKQKASFTADFFSEYHFEKSYAVNFEVNEFSTDQKFVNLILGVGAKHDLNDHFTLEFNCGKYLQKINQNYYFSLGFNQIFLSKKHRKTTS